MTITMLIVAAVVSAQPTPMPPSRCDPAPPAVAAVRAVADGIIAADNNRDLERVKAAYAADAVLMPPNEPPAQGWSSIQPRYDALFAGFTPAIVGQIDEVCVSGRVAFVRGRNTGQMVGRGQSATRALNDVYVMLLRLDADARWRISHLIWHSGVAPMR